MSDVFDKISEMDVLMISRCRVATQFSHFLYCPNTKEPFAQLPPSLILRHGQTSSLPNCDGPKLEPFTQNFEDLEFEPELLIKSEDNIPGVIVKAKIDGETFAIKFFNQRDIEFHLHECHPDLTEDEFAIAVMQIEPFGAECRSYGRLKETNQEHLAAKAYGYVKVHINDRTEEMFKPLLQAKKIQNLAEMFEPVEWMNPDEAEKVKGQPVMGIVKEWCETWDPEEDWDNLGPFLEPVAASAVADQKLVRACPRLLRELHQLHRIGIVIRDMNLTQYVGGKLVDFGQSLTFPNILGQAGPSRPEWASASWAARDLFDFQYKVIRIVNDSLEDATMHIMKSGRKNPRYKKSTLVAYPKAGTREGLRPLPHREREYLPLLLFAEKYPPKQKPLVNTEILARLAWTYGPRFDPGKFRLENASTPQKRRRNAGREKRRKK